jgi:hypothetical protein
MHHNASAILAISSLDRYTTGVLGTLSRNDTALFNLYSGVGQPGNKFQLSSNGAYIYGYITRIAVSQLQVEYRVPTVVPSNNVWPEFANDPTALLVAGNDVFSIDVSGNGINTQHRVRIPYGFYTPAEMAAMLQACLREYAGLETMTVAYSEAFLPPAGTNPYTGYGGGNSFIFETDQGFNYRFPGALELKERFGEETNQITTVLKTYRLLGIEQNVNVGHPFTNFYQTQSPNFMYTSFIDIISNNLTKFQKVKDSDTSTYGRVGVIQRAYLSGVGNPQATSATYALGSQPFIITMDLNTPKIIRWNKDETVYNLDFELFDQYGDPLFWTPNFGTEFQMTLLCMEEDD